MLALLMDKRVIAGIALLALLTAFLVWLGSERKEARKDGRRDAETEQQAKVIETTEKVNDAREQTAQDIRSGGSPELYANCLRSARNPENCKRFLP